MHDHFDSSEPRIWPGMLLVAAVVALVLTLLMYLMQ